MDAGSRVLEALWGVASLVCHPQDRVRQDAAGQSRRAQSVVKAADKAHSNAVFQDNTSVSIGAVCGDDDSNNSTRIAAMSLIRCGLFTKYKSKDRSRRSLAS